MSKDKVYQLTPLGLLYSLESHQRAYPDQALKELFGYASKIGKNAIRFRKNGDAVFVALQKRRK